MDIIAIIVAGVVAMAIGWAWYSPFLFGKQWVAGNAPTQGDMNVVKPKAMGMLFALSFIGELVTAFVVYKVLDLTATTGFLGGAQLVLLLWLGFMVPLEMGRILWLGKPWNIFFIAASQDAVQLIGMAAVFALLLK